MQIRIDYAAFALDTLIYNLIIAQIVFIVIVVISASVAIYVDLKVWRQQRITGNQKHWYTRPTFLFCLGVTLAMIAIFIDSATTTHFFPNTLFWNALDIVFLLIVLVLILGGFISVVLNSRRKA
jgi:cell division protein FtsW (lipid II flippase)